MSSQHVCAVLCAVLACESRWHVCERVCHWAYCQSPCCMPASLYCIVMTGGGAACEWSFCGVVQSVEPYA